MSLSPDHKLASEPEPKTQDGAYAAWGLILGGILGAIPALIVGGSRMFALAAVLATTGWMVGAFIDRSKR